ncbi:hypothetical protein C8Q72DRAFT_566624 [Fomitopsis betulina]|nr:hypothetical protein C8Q72DRAFT_566624 [Fomitopsis betulina]
MWTETSSSHFLNADPNTPHAPFMPSSESWLSGEDIRVFAKCDQLTLNQAKFNVFADDLAGDPVHVTHWNRTCVMEVALLDDWNTVAAESAKYSEAHHVKKEEEVDDASLLLGDHQHTAIDVDGDTSGPPAHWWQSDDECGILELDSSGHEGSEFQPEDSPRRSSWTMTYASKSVTSNLPQATGGGSCTTAHFGVA